MADPTVVVTDYNFPDLSIERRELADVADVVHGGATTPEEPPAKSPLLDRDEVVLTPHVAWYSEDSIDDLRRTLARDVRRILNDEEPENPVNDLDR